MDALFSFMNIILRVVLQLTVLLAQLHTEYHGV